MPATKARANQLGWRTPAGSDQISDGDNVITDNALLCAETRDILGKVQAQVGNAAGFEIRSGTVTTAPPGTGSAITFTGSWPVYTVNAQLEAGNPTQYELRGNGAPTATAPAGTYYTDTNGTAGAWRWLRTPAGWTVVTGDVRRDIKSAAAAGIAADSAAVTRSSGPIVTLTLELRATGSVAIGSTMIVVPDGFRPADWQLLTAYGNAANVGISPSGSVVTYTALSAGQLVKFGATWRTPNNWPTS